jgi:hypothetical protein
MNAMTKPVRGERAAARDRVLLGATLVSHAGSHRVRVRDFSPTGCQIVADEPLPSGVDAIFQRAGLFAAARIVWSEGKEAGLQFYREVE